MRSAKATPALLARLVDEDVTARRAVVAALGEIGDPRAAGRLVQLLGDPALQAAALEGLRRMGSAALAEIERGFAAVPPEARRLLVDLVQRLDDLRARRLLLAAVADSDPAVRAEAALAVGEGGLLEAVRHLTDLKTHDPSPVVRRAAAQALKKLAPR